MKATVSASVSDIASSVSLGEGTSIVADRIVLEEGVQIGSNVEITCDELVIGKGTRIGSNTKITSPSIVIGDGGVFSGNLEAEFNEYFHVGRLALVGKHNVFSGQGLKAGDLLVLRDHVVIGGGGAKGPNSYLTMGDRVVIIDYCFINLSERVDIGSSTALSRGVTLLTHAAWQPVLEGFSSKFAPVRIGENSVVYLNSSIMPGVNIGNYTAIGAHSLVTRDVPDHCLAAGVPAVVRRGPDEYGTPLTIGEQYALVEEAMTDYLTTLPPKGVRVMDDSIAAAGSFTLAKDGLEERFTLLRSGRTPQAAAQVTLALEDVPLEWRGGYHIDLAAMDVSGTASILAEDFRDYLRRRAIRVGSRSQYRTLPLVNLERLKKKGRAERSR